MKHFMKNAAVFFVVLLALSFVFVGCKREKEAEVIKIGVAGAHTGDLASYGIPSKRAVELVTEMVNADGSVDVYFGPKSPQGKENNWVQTVPGTGWNVVLRMYGALEPWFNKTWRPGEIELLR